MYMLCDRYLGTKYILRGMYDSYLVSEYVGRCTIGA